jgi:hypothetical protein
MGKKKIYSKNISSLLRSETSILVLLKEFRKKFITNKKRTSQDIKPGQIDLPLAKKILDEVFGEYVGDPEDLTRVVFQMEQGGLNLMTISFGKMVDTDFLGDHHDEEWEVFTSLSVVFYIAATYPKFTLEILQSHLEEFETLEFFGQRYYLEVVKRYNKKLPPDVKLWLELNH